MNCKTCGKIIRCKETEIDRECNICQGDLFRTCIVYFEKLKGPNCKELILQTDKYIDHVGFN